MSSDEKNNISTVSALVLSKIDQTARGPTPFSNWVIPNLLLASGFPGDKDPDTHKIKIRKFIDAGVQVVVNIMTIKESGRMLPYQEIMLEYAKQENRDVKFISFPICDGSVHQDDQRVLDFCLELCDQIKQGQVVLVHCRGGHGRTGTIISIMIGILFNLNSKEAMSINKRLHEQRVLRNRIASPQTQPQKEQVRIVLDEMYHKNKEEVDQQA